MGRPRKLVKLSIKETSGVDHPAHLHEGWLVMKSADASEVTDVLDELRTESDEVEGEAEVEAEPVIEVEIEAEKSLDAPTTVSKEETMNLTPEETTAETVIIPESATEADIRKAMPAAIREVLEKAEASAAAAEFAASEALRKAAESERAYIAERDARADEAAVLKAAEWSHLTCDPTVVGPALRRLAGTDPVLANEIVKALDSANAVAEANAVFTEVGSDAPVASDTAFAKMESLANALVADGTAPSYAVAITKVAEANPSLYLEYIAEKGR